MRLHMGSLSGSITPRELFQRFSLDWASKRLTWSADNSGWSKAVFKIFRSLGKSRGFEVLPRGLGRTGEDPGRHVLETSE